MSVGMIDAHGVGGESALAPPSTLPIVTPKRSVKIGEEGYTRCSAPDSDTDVISAVNGCPLVTVTAGASCKVTATLVVESAV